jgi:hypothetical protein
MHWGLTKRQWFLLCSLLLFPLTLNIVAMWYEVRREFLVEAICTGIWTYATNYEGLPFYIRKNPWLPIGKAVVWFVPIGLFAYCLVLASSQKFWRIKPFPIRVIFAVLVSLFLACLLAYWSYSIAEARYWAFYPFDMAFGIHISKIGLYGSVFVVAPLSFVLLFLALLDRSTTEVLN